MMRRQSTRCTLRSLEVGNGGAGTLCSPSHHASRFISALSTAPLSACRLVFVGEVGLCGRDELGELGVVLGPDILESKDGGLLLVDHCPETCLVLDNDVRDAHLAAESGDEDDELDGVNVIGDDDEVGLLGLDQGNTVVETHLDEEGLLVILAGGLLAVVGSNGLRLLVEACLLLLPRLRAVLVEEAEELGRRVLVEGVAELGERGRDLQALVEDNLLPLQLDVLGPLDEAGQITGRLDVLANAKVLGSLLEERVGGLLGGGLLAERGVGDLLAGRLLGGSSGGLNCSSSNSEERESWSR